MGPSHIGTAESAVGAIAKVYVKRALYNIRKSGRNFFVNQALVLNELLIKTQIWNAKINTHFFAAVQTWKKVYRGQ